MKIPDDKYGKQLDGFAMFCDAYRKEIYETLTMDETGIITCPICRTVDFRLKYTPDTKGYCGARGGVLPEEILYYIKNLPK